MLPFAIKYLEENDPRLKFKRESNTYIKYMDLDVDDNDENIIDNTIKNNH